MLQGNKFGSNEEVIAKTKDYFQIVLHEELQKIRGVLD